MDSENLRSNNSWRALLDGTLILLFILLLVVVVFVFLLVLVLSIIIIVSSSLLLIVQRFEATQNFWVSLQNIVNKSSI